jgi:regulator of replication initiation timing
MEFEANSYENSIVSTNFNEKINEIQILNEKMKSLVEENNLLRETPHNQKLEEELVEVKLRDAEAQLAIKELQKTIHVLNLEYQVSLFVF